MTLEELKGHIDAQERSYGDPINEAAYLEPIVNELFRLRVEIAYLKNTKEDSILSILALQPPQIS